MRVYLQMLTVNERDDERDDAYVARLAKCEILSTIMPMVEASVGSVFDGCKLAVIASHRQSAARRSCAAARPHGLRRIANRAIKASATCVYVRHHGWSAAVGTAVYVA